MKTINYESPQIEVIEIEIENVLCASGDLTRTVNDPASFEGYESAW